MKEARRWRSLGSRDREELKYIDNLASDFKIATNNVQMDPIYETYSLEILSTKEEFEILEWIFHRIGRLKDREW